MILLNSLLQNDPFFLIRNKGLRLKDNVLHFKPSLRGDCIAKLKSLKKRFLVKCLTLKHNITRHSEIASTRELQVLFEVSGVVFLEVFTKVKDSYNFPSFKE